VHYNNITLVQRDYLIEDKIYVRWLYHVATKNALAIFFIFGNKEVIEFWGQDLNFTRLQIGTQLWKVDEINGLINYTVGSAPACLDASFLSNL